MDLCAYNHHGVILPAPDHPHALKEGGDAGNAGVGNHYWRSFNADCVRNAAGAGGKGDIGLSDMLYVSFCGGEDKACFGRYFNALDGLFGGLYGYFVKEGCAGKSVPFKETAAAAFTRRFEHLLYGVS